MQLKRLVGFAGLIFFSCCNSEPVIEEYPINDPFVLEVTGSDYDWHIRYPGKDGILHTTDDLITSQDFHLPAQTNILFRLNSQDYIYTLDLPSYEAREMAVPGMELSLKFNSGKKGRHPFRGDQMCGYTHESLHGQLIVQSKNRFYRWLSRQKQHKSDTL